MRQIACTLLTDGPTDVALIPILEWTMRQHAKKLAIQFEWADFRRLPSPPHTLTDKIAKAVDLYPCHVLFVHRDAEGQDPELRYGQILSAIQAVREHGIDVPYICVVPVRMQEAWLLMDGAAIRRAVDNPSGVMDLELPQAKQIENLPDPKARLYDTLKKASGLHGRRLKRFRPDERACRVPDYITGFEALRALSAFRRLEDDIRDAFVKLAAATP
jgi:hypothetical protein